MHLKVSVSRGLATVTELCDFCDKETKNTEVKR